MRRASTSESPASASTERSFATADALSFRRARSLASARATSTGSSISSAPRLARRIRRALTTSGCMGSAGLRASDSSMDHSCAGPKRRCFSTSRSTTAVIPFTSPLASRMRASRYEVQILEPVSSDSVRRTGRSHALHSGRSAMSRIARVSRGSRLERATVPDSRRSASEAEL